MDKQYCALLNEIPEEADKFGISIVNTDRPNTCKGMLNIVSSVFDPFGYVRPFVMVAKRLQQEACKRKIS